MESVVSQLGEIGIEELNLATNYHAVQSFAPRSDQSKTHFARASAYFSPRAGYGRLRPQPYEGMEGDWVAEIATASDGIDLNSWTVGCHNSRLGQANPDVTLTSPYGDDLVFGLCPSHPEVQQYLTSLVADLASRGEFRRIELETFDYFYGTGFGWHHQKIQLELGPLGEFLFGLCFCDHCRARDQNADADHERVRGVVIETLDAIMAGSLESDTSPERWLDRHPAVADYVRMRQDTLVALFTDLAAAAQESQLGYYLGAPEPGREWMVGADVARLSDHVDYFCLPAYESSSERVLRAYRTIADLDVDVPLHVGLLPGHPAIEDGETVSRIVDSLREEGVPRVSFYNYGLLPERSLGWIEAAIR
jgi:hypothetical protein